MTSGKESEAHPPWQDELNRLLGALDTERVIFFPVRHHSPACAWHLTRLIRERRPASVLVEGPDSFTVYIPHLLSDETRFPVALFAQFVDRKGRTLAEPKEPTDSSSPPRYGAFYPLCDYSPELVALQEGHAIGARLAFCDLAFCDQVLSQPSRTADAPRTASLLNDHHLARSAYLLELARRRHCRDTDELWDRLFECDFLRTDTPAFVRNVAAYCFFARVHTPEDELERDGTLARERHMLRKLKNEQRRLKRAGVEGPLLVVTGGFHTAALARAGAAPRREAKGESIPPKDQLQAMVAYSFEQLDALNGYTAGMPSPHYYQRLWDHRERPQAEVLEQIAREVLVELPRRTREARTASPVSTAGAIAALAHARSLAAFRGNPGPLREDVLDGVRSCFVQGELDVGGSLVLDMALALMRGDTVGQVPEGAEEHPIVMDFRRQTTAFAIQLDTSTPRDRDLEIYRKPKHRRISRFFHQLALLETQFARLVSGPDFLGGRGLDLQVEHWTYAWSPLVAARLVECSMYGSTVEEAAAGRLEERLRAMNEEGGEVGAVEAVGLLTVCCLLGLHARANVFAPAMEEKLHHEQVFGECAAATGRLDLLGRYRGPLATDRIPTLPRLLVGAYQRCCRLVAELGNCPEAELGPTLDGFAHLRELLLHRDRGGEDDALDQELFWSAVREGLARPGVHPCLHGGLVGLAFSSGKLSEQELRATFEGGLHGTDQDGSTAPSFLRGLFTLCREITWQQSALMDLLDQKMASWDEAEFYAALPYLRLAFSHHTPQETDRVADLLSHVHPGHDLGDRVLRELDESAMAAFAGAAARAHASLEADGLLGWTDA